METYIFLTYLIQYNKYDTQKKNNTLLLRKNWVSLRK